VFLDEPERSAPRRDRPPLLYNAPRRCRLLKAAGVPIAVQRVFLGCWASRRLKAAIRLVDVLVVRRVRSRSHLDRLGTPCRPGGCAPYRRARREIRVLSVASVDSPQPSRADRADFRWIFPRGLQNDNPPQPPAAIPSSRFILCQVARCRRRVSAACADKRQYRREGEENLPAPDALDILDVRFQPPAFLVMAYGRWAFSCCFGANQVPLIVPLGRFVGQRSGL